MPVMSKSCSKGLKSNGGFVWPRTFLFLVSTNCRNPVFDDWVLMFQFQLSPTLRPRPHCVWKHIIFDVFSPIIHTVYNDRKCWSFSLKTLLLLEPYRISVDKENRVFQRRWRHSHQVKSTSIAGASIYRMEDECCCILDRFRAYSSVIVWTGKTLRKR